MRKMLFWLLLLPALPAAGAELTFDLGEFPTNGPPPGFSSLLYGHGRPGDWQIVMDAVPPIIAPATDKAPVVTKRTVLAQLKLDPTGDRAPMLIYEGESFGDFALTTRFKITDGLIEQVAGIAFRVQNETNFYVVHANAMDNHVRFFKVVDGMPSPMLGRSVPVSLGQWHRLKIVCTGNRIRIWLDDTETIKEGITDTSFTSGKIGFWTMSDSRCSFTDTRVTYQPREPLVQAIVRNVLAKYSRLRDLKVYLPDENGGLRVAAAKNPADVGQPAEKPQREVMDRTTVFVAKTKQDMSVVLPVARPERGHHRGPDHRPGILSRPDGGERHQPGHGDCEGNRTAGEIPGGTPGVAGQGAGAGATGSDGGRFRVGHPAQAAGDGDVSPLIRLQTRAGAGVFIRLLHEQRAVRVAHRVAERARAGLIKHVEVAPPVHLRIRLAERDRWGRWRTP